MPADEPKKAEPVDRGISLNFWHGVAALFVGSLFYAQVWQQLDFPPWLYLVAAFIAEPGSFSKLAVSYGVDALKALRGKT